VRKHFSAPTSQTLRGHSVTAWIDLAKICPGHPEIVLASVRAELGKEFKFVVDPQVGDLAKLVSAERKRFAVMRRGLARARKEAQNRRELQDALAYWSAVTALGEGDREAATHSLLAARASRLYLRSTLDRLEAIAAMQREELPRARTLAFTAALAGDRNERVLSEYVLALALDRSGDFSGAAAFVAKSAAVDPGRQLARILQAWLPPTEKVYLEALILSSNPMEVERAKAWWTEMEASSLLSANDRARASAHVIALTR
jgi:hypothetical protein